MTYVGPNMPLLASDVVSWLEGLLPDEKIWQGPDLPKYPGRFVLVTPAQGGGLVMEYAFDQPGFQLHAVGPQSRDARVNASAAQAEALIFTLDRLILNQQWPQNIAGHHVTHAQRFGSGPTPLPTDNGGRAHYVATYLMQAESGYAF